MYAVACVVKTASAMTCLCAIGVLSQRQGARETEIRAAIATVFDQQRQYIIKKWMEAGKHLGHLIIVYEYM